MTTRVIKGWDCVNEDANPMDDNGHGTHEAGIIAAKQNNLEGLAGVSPSRFPRELPVALLIGGKLR